MNDTSEKPTTNSLSGLPSWFRSTVTLSLPGWAFAAGALALVILLLVALD